jgi:hypothetical protein
MCWPLWFVLLLTLALGACTSAPLTLSPALEAEFRTLVRTQCAPGGPVLPRPTATPADAAAPGEVG